MSVQEARCARCGAHVMLSRVLNSGWPCETKCWSCGASVALVDDPHGVLTSWADDLEPEGEGEATTERASGRVS